LALAIRCLYVNDRIVGEPGLKIHYAACTWDEVRALRGQSELPEAHSAAYMTVSSLKFPRPGPHDQPSNQQS
jgi:hypothetical protein